MAELSRAGRRLLGRTSYLIRTGFDSEQQVDTYEVLDGETGAELATASEMRPDVLRRLVRATFGRNVLPTIVQVYEPGGGTPVLVIRELPSIWRPCFSLVDPAGGDLCLFTGVFAVIGGGFVVRDRRGHLVGRVQTDMDDGRYFFRSRTGQTVGTIENRAVLSDFPWGQDRQEYYVRLEETNGCDKVADALLLGTALGLDIIYRDRIGTGVKEARKTGIKAMTSAPSR